jgi:hypothetical protein
MSNIKATKEKSMSSTVAAKEKTPFNPSTGNGKRGIDVLRDPIIDISPPFPLPITLLKDWPHGRTQRACRPDPSVCE